jgi:hypothetical protein
MTEEYQVDTKDWFHEYLGMKADLESLLRVILEPRAEDEISRDIRIDEFCRLNYPREYEYWKFRGRF